MSDGVADAADAAAYDSTQAEGLKKHYVDISSLRSERSAPGEPEEVHAALADVEPALLWNWLSRFSIYNVYRNTRQCLSGTTNSTTTHFG